MIDAPLMPLNSFTMTAAALYTLSFASNAQPKPKLEGNWMLNKCARCHP